MKQRSSHQLSLAQEEKGSAQHTIYVQQDTIDRLQKEVAAVSRDGGKEEGGKEEGGREGREREGGRREGGRKGRRRERGWEGGKEEGGRGREGGEGGRGEGEGGREGGTLTRCYLQVLFFMNSII